MRHRSYARPRDGLHDAVNAGVSAPATAAGQRWLESLRDRPLMLGVGGLALLGIVAVAGVALGNVSIPLGDTVAMVAHRFFGVPVDATWTASAETIVFELRMPRVLMAVGVGAGLALSGAAFQGLLRNPLADPYVLGTASGAALGA